MAKDMYTLPKNLKLFSIVLVVVGLIGIVYSFMTVPKSVDDVAHIVTVQNESASEKGTEATSGFVDKVRGEDGFSEQTLKQSTDMSSGSSSQAEHLLRQMRVRPFSATFVAAFFFFMIALGVLVFYAIQHVAQAGWSPILYRVMEGITSYVLPGSIIVFLLVMLAGSQFYPWQNAEYMAGDKVLQAKTPYLNMPFFVIRAVLYLLIWNIYRFYSRKNSLLQDTATNYDYYRKNYKASVIFLALFFITESTMAWDWFMSMTPHWLSAMHAWYIFASMFVAGVTALTLIVIYLKRQGHLPLVSDKHLHDLAKYIFAFSIFWTYIWFGEFMLIWYSNIPDEVVYFVMRIQEYPVLFFGMLILNFVFPLIILMNSDFKRIPWIVVIVSFVVLVGHYIVIFLLVMPSTVGANWHFGVPEIAAICFFLGLFIYTVGTNLAKTELRPKNDPFIRESENYHF